MNIPELKSQMVTRRLAGQPYGGLTVMCQAMEQEAFKQGEIRRRLRSDKVVEHILEDIKDYENDNLEI